MRTENDIETLIEKARAVRLMFQEVEAKSCDYLLKYNAGQPRVPGGNSNGGQWTSENGVNFIKKFELFVPHVYGDEGEKPTIGYGHLIMPQESFPGSMSHEEGLKLLRRDLRTAENTVKRYVTAPSRKTSSTH